MRNLPNKQFKLIRNAQRFRFQLVWWLRCCVLLRWQRCSQLNWALYARWRKSKILGQYSGFSALNSGSSRHKLSFRFSDSWFSSGLSFADGFLLWCGLRGVKRGDSFRCNSALWLYIFKSEFACWKAAFSGVVSSRGFSEFVESPHCEIAVPKALFGVANPFSAALIVPSGFSGKLL